MWGVGLRLRPCVSVLALATSAGAWAADGTGTTNALDQTIIVTGTRPVTQDDGLLKSPALVEDIPQSIQIIPERIIREQLPITLSDVVRNVSGISATRNSSEPFRTFNIRGFSALDVLVDGFRSTQALNIQPEGLANIESVSILKGPASAIGGRGNVGGAVNLTTKRPLNAFQANLALSAGTDEFFRPSIDLTGPFGTSNIRYRLIAEYGHRESFIDFITIDQVQLAPSLAVSLTPQTSARLQLDYRRQEQLRYPGLPRYGTVEGLNDLRLAVSRNFSEPGLGEGVATSHQSTLVLEHEFGSDARIQVALRHTRTDNYLPGVGLGVLGADRRTLPRSYSVFDEVEKETALEVNGHWRVKALGLEHLLSAGADFNRFTYDSAIERGQLAPINIANPVYGATPTNVRPLDRTIDGVRAYGAFIQDLVTLTPALKLLLGARIDRIENERVNALTGTRLGEITTVVSPRVGATWEAAPGVTLYSSWSRAVAPASNFNRLRGDLLPPPIRGEQVEAGVKFGVADQVQATLAAFELRRQNVPVPDPTDPSGLFSVVSGEQRSRGVELDVLWQPLPRLSVLGAYAYIKADVTKSTVRGVPMGNELPNVPRHLARLWLTYELPIGRDALSMSGGLTHQSRSFGDNANSFAVPRFTVLDAAIRYRMGNQELALNVQNLTDKRYILRAAFDGRNVIPGDPLRAIVTLRTLFQ